METFSMNIISHTLSQHSEMIAPGVMGINFMKPEKPINTMSEVYKLVQEEEQNKVKSPTPGSCTSPPTWQATKVPPSVPPKPKVTPPSVQPPVLKPVAPAAPKAPEGPSQGPCSDCGRIITGAFVNLSDRILHEDCFNCSTCGAGLKNIGYHNINNKLYCDTHAMLAARVIAGNAATPSPYSQPVASPAPVAAPRPAPVAPPTLPTTPLPTSNLTPQPSVAPAPLPVSNLYQSAPTPFGLTNLPHSPSSSGNLTFRSISPQPFKRISGEYHRVNAPSSPTPGSTPSAPAPSFSSGPLPFEMKPYLPPEQSRISLFSSGLSESQSSQEITQSSQVSQVVQKTTQVTRQMTEQVSHSSSQYSVDYKQVVGGGGGLKQTKFVWPPPKSPFEVEGSAPNPTPSQPYSPLVTQPAPVQSQQEFKTEAPPSTFSVPPLPTTFSAPQETAPPAPVTTQIPVEVEEIPAPPAAPEPPKEVPIPEPAPAPIVSAPVMAPPIIPPLPKSSGSFAPVLPPIVDLKPATTPLQPGVPTGAGSKPAPKKGRGQLMQEHIPGRIAICGDCGDPIRGPFIIALNRTWCPDHFRCNNAHCQRALIDVGFVEEQGQLYCESCYEAYLAPLCNKCNVRIKGDCLNALDRQWHPECFICTYCNKPFGNNSFYLEDGLPYCEKDWNELFTTKCVGCGFPIEAGDRWVEALNNNYHSQCFKCSICQKNLEGQSFYAKGGKPFCKQHAR